jgi:hypothetical protein
MEKGDRMGGCLQVVPFYRKSRNKDTWGKGLGIANKNEFSTVTTSVVAGEIAPQQILGANTAAATTVKLNPEHYAVGANLQWNQCLSELYEGLYLSVNSAIVQDNRRDNFEISAANPAHATAIKALLVKTAGKKGRYSENTWVNQSGLESPEIMLGYNFVDSDAAKVGLNLAGVIPTGTDPSLELVNEPLVGGRHFELGAGLNACANLMNDESYSLKAYFNANYRYAFQRTVKVLPRLTGVAAASSNMEMGHCFKVTDANTSVSDQYGLDAEVKPGSKLDGYAMLCYCMDNFCLDLGYNLKFAQAHTPKEKGTFVATNIQAANGAAFNVALTAANLDRKREQMLIHRFTGNAGMTMRDWDYPVMFGLGGSFDVASKKQITPENWQVHGKVGVCF